jgi:hypothetical protein
MADRAREWDGDAAEKRVRKWAGAEDKPNQKYRDAHIWYDSDKKDNFTAYKLLFATTNNRHLRQIDLNRPVSLQDKLTTINSC